MTDPNLLQSSQPDLRSYLRPVWTRRWLLVLLLVAVVGGTYLYYDSKPRLYTAETKIFVGRSEAQAAIAQYGDLSSDRTVQNVATLLTTPELAKRIGKRIKFPASGTALLERFSAVPVRGSDFIVMTATWDTAAGAAQLANVASQEFVALRSERERRALETGLREREQQLARIPRSTATAIERNSLASTVQQLKLALSLPTGGAEVVSEAFPPEAATSPRPKRNALFAGVLALLAGVGLAFGLERFDRRLKDIDDVRTNYRADVLAVIPRAGDPGHATERGNALASEFREPFRDLLTNVQLMALDKPLRKLLVTSAVPGEGKSTIVRNLAIALREYGLSVAVVDADLRRPTQVELMHVQEDGHSGLSTVLTGHTTLREALVDVTVDVRGLDTLRRIREQGGHAPGPWGAMSEDLGDSVGGLELLPPGPLPANPQAVLGADRTRQVIDELAETHDIVLIDSPPLLAVSDSVPLLSQSDAVVIVSRLGLATRETARRLLELLRRVPGERWIGVVANDLRVGELSSYTYGYGYGYAYGYKAKRRMRLDADDASTHGRPRARWWKRQRGHGDSSGKAKPVAPFPTGSSNGGKSSNGHGAGDEQAGRKSDQGHLTA